MADGLPEGFELEGGGQTAPAPLRPVQLAPIPAPAPPRLLPSLQTQPGMTAGAPPIDAFMQGQPGPGNAPAASPGRQAAGLPPGFELEPPVRQLNPVAGAAGSFANAIPVLGQAPTYIHAGLGAAKSYISPDETSPTQGGFFNRAGQILERDRREQEAFEQKHPIVSMVASAGGIGATAAGGVGLLRAAPVVGGRLLGMVGGGPVKQALASAASGAAIGGADLALRGGDPTTGALTGAVIGAPAPAIGRAIGGIAGKIAASRAASNPALQMQAEQVAEGVVGGKARYGAPLVEGNKLTSEAYQVADKTAYDKVDRLGTAINPAGAKDAIADVQSALQSDNFWRTHNRPVFDVVDKLSNPYHPNLSFGELQATLQKLNAMTRTFPPDPNAAAARVAHDALANWMEALPKNPKFVAGGNVAQALADLQVANRSYKASMDFRKIEKQIEEAQLRNATGRVEDLPGKLKDTFKPLLREINTGKWRPPADVAKAVRQTAAGSTYGLRSVGKLTPQSGIPMFGEIAAVLAGHPLKAIATAGGGWAARKGEQRIVMGRAQQALQTAAAQHPATAAFGALNPITRAAAASRLGRFGSAAPGLSAIRARSIIGPIDEREADAQYNY